MHNGRRLPSRRPDLVAKAEAMYLSMIDVSPISMAFIGCFQARDFPRRGPRFSISILNNLDIILFLKVQS